MRGDKVYANLVIDTSLGSQTVSITIPSSGVLGIDVDSQEEADDLHNRLTWIPMWAAEPVGPFEVGCEPESKRETFQYGMDSGILELGAQRDDLREMFIYGSVLKGVLVMEKGSESWTANFYPSTETPRPYVLSAMAISNSWVPDMGYSALPKSMKKRIPNRLAYWEEDDTERRAAIRDYLVKQIDDKHIFIPYSKTYNSRFTLFENISSKGTDWQLVLQGDKSYQFSMHESPLEMTEVTLRESTGLNPDNGKDGLVMLNNIPYKATDWGNSTIYENYPERMVVEFYGAKHCGLWTLTKQSEQLWYFTLGQAARNREHSPPPDKIDTIITMSQANKERSEIARAIGYSKQTVWAYQKQLGFV